MVAGVSLAPMYLVLLISNDLQNNGPHYPTLRHIAIDFLACPASSVPCKRLFSCGGEIATKRRAQLGVARFEELQIMKLGWKNNIGDLAAWNSSQVEEIDDELGEYRDLLAVDGEQAKWDEESKVVSFHSI